MYAPTVAGKKDRRLTCGVSPSNDRHFLALTELRFEVRRRIVDAGAAELADALHRHRPILRPGRNDNDVRLQNAPIAQLNRVRPLIALQTRDARRNVDLCAELLRLHERAAGERLPGNSGRKSEIVFDLGTRTGLPSGRNGLQYDGGQAFRGCIDGRGKAGRSGADDDQIVHPCVIDLGIHPEAFGNLVIRRVSEHMLGATDHDRYIFCLHMKAIEQRTDVWIVLDIHVEVGMRIAREKFLQTQRASGMARSEQHDLTLLRRDQTHLHLGDTQAIPILIEKLSASGERGYWWQCGRYIWSAGLTEALDKWLERRRSKKTWTWGKDSESDWITAELVRRLPERESERLLLNHWDHLHFSRNFVQAALYAATPRLKDAAAAAIKACPEPLDLLKYISQHYGIRTAGRSGVTRPEQILALSPYLHLMGSVDISALWNVCNKQGWFDLRHELLDARLQPPFVRKVLQAEEAATAFDKFVAEKQLHSVSYWIDRKIDADVPWSEILAALKTWFDERKSIEALQVVAAALEHRGKRQDLSVMRVYETMPQDVSKQFIADIEFAVRRRTIH